MNTLHYQNSNMVAYRAWVQPSARLLLCICVFLLTGLPRAGIKLGPAPIYVIDIFIALTFFAALKVRTTHHFRHPFSKYIFIIAFFAVLGEGAAMVYSGDIIRPVYALSRTFLALSLAYSAARIIQTREDVAAVTRAATLGIGITALLMVLSSLPGARGLVASTVFSISFLEPAVSAAEKYGQFAQYSTRGRSLVGVSILSGAFINTFWPLIALHVRTPENGRKWRLLAFAVCMLAPFGIVMSYSRGAILGLILVVAGLLVFGSSRVRRGVFGAVICATLVFSAIGWDSELFYFERVTTRTDAMLNNPYEDVRETERLYAYSEPFEHLFENPVFLIFGEGTSIGKTSAIPQQAGQATHAVFASAYYCYGMVAALTYLLMAISIVLHLWRNTRRTWDSGMITALYYQALFAGSLGLLSWFMLGHAAVSTPRGAMLLFLLLGIISALRNVEASELTEIYGHIKV